jgi:signal peptidase I
MISFFKKRRMRKELKEYLHAARHARNMRGDIADPADLVALEKAEAAVSAIRETGAADKDIETAVNALDEATEKIYPSSNRSGMRENVEVIIVAIGAAMAIRAFFFQPYKIPTGSMQPTLNGIKVEAQAEPTAMDRMPFKFFKWVVTGTSYKENRAKGSGAVIPYQVEAEGENGEKVIKLQLFAMDGDKYVMNIGGTEQKIPAYMVGLVDPDKTSYKKGDVIARAKVITGDHILVNKMKYNFMQPGRGDIAVFDTRNLERVRANTFYIKRMVGMPTEKIQIKDNRYLVADGEIVEDPLVFKMINEDSHFAGLTFAGNLSDNDAFIQLSDAEYMMMGDNTENSKDGRYFGGVPRSEFQGSAFFVYWPFREHWGTIE